MLEEYWNPSKNSVPSSNIPPIPPIPINLSVQNPNNYYYAGFLIRAVAFLGDGIIIGGIVILLGVILLLINDLLGLNNDFSRIVKVDGSVIFGVVGYLYFILLTALFGATIGKKSMGLKVVKRDFTRTNFLQIVIRELIGRTLSNIFTMGYFIIPFNKKKRGLHDFIAGTVVIRKSPPSKHEMLRIFLVLFGIPILGIILVGLLATFDLLGQRNKAKNYAVPTSGPIPTRTGKDESTEGWNKYIDMNYSESSKSGWLEFTNKKNSYSIKYPPSFTIKAFPAWKGDEDLQTQDGVDISRKTQNSYLLLRILKETKTQNESLKEYVEKKLDQEQQNGKSVPNFPMVKIIKDSIIDGKKVIYTSNDLRSKTYWDLPSVYVEKDDIDILEVFPTTNQPDDTESLQLFYQMVSTLKFTDGSGK